jgi:putative NIF3 family GTP cyclohydrolase 1 type 2
MRRISRREFVAVTATGGAAAPFGLGGGTAAAALTAREVVDRITAKLGVEWTPGTVDGFKAGGPSTLVTGIVTTAMATLDVLRKAAEARANLVITCEPTFYSRADAPTPPAGRRGGGPVAKDPVFEAKADFIRRHSFVVFRLSEHWRLRRPDAFAQGLADALGWSGIPGADDSRVSIPPTPLDVLVSMIEKKLGARGGIRVVGDPDTRVQRIGLLPGSTPIQASLRLLPGVDAIVAGEVREWESVEYARDVVAQGGKKALILLGRIVSEDPGMHACARWLKTVVPEVATTWMPAGDPYWRPR